MKRILTILFALVLLVMLLVACDQTGGTEDGGDSTTTSSTSSTSDTTPPPNAGNFLVCADQLVRYSTEENKTIQLSVTGEDATPDAQVTYEVDGNATVDENGVVTFRSRNMGACTVTATINGKVSRNTLNLYLVYDQRASFAEQMEERGFAKLDLGGKLELPLSYTQLDYLSVTADESLRVGLPADDGSYTSLAVIGVPHEATLTIRDLDDDVYWSGTIHVSARPIGSAVRAAATLCGIATADTDTITPAMLATIPSLTLHGYAPADLSGWDFLSHLPALTKLDLSGSTIFDLSFLNGRTRIQELALENIPSFDLAGRDTFLSTLTTLTGLEKLSIRGSIGVLDRTTCTTLVDSARAGRFSLAVLDGVTLDATSPDGFMQTVFFSVAEVKAHTEANGGKLVAASGYSHAIISYLHDLDNRWNRAHVNAGDITTLEIYGGTRTALSATGDLTLNLYNGKISMSTNDGQAIYSTANLAIRAIYGTCGVQGGWSVWWTENGNTWCVPNASAVVCRDLTLYAAPGASLTLTGGDGNIGSDGDADGSNPADSTSQKHAARGDDGRPAIDAENVTILGGTMVITGGKGGPGGKGGDGTGVNIFNGGYDGGDGGDGGNGGAGILCKSYTLAPDADAAAITITGGAGGSGGAGGDGFAAGKNGTAGDPGNKGGTVVIR